jgi:hypothetical protein
VLRQRKPKLSRYKEIDTDDALNGNGNSAQYEFDERAIPERRILRYVQSGPIVNGLQHLLPGTFAVPSATPLDDRQR